MKRNLQNIKSFIYTPFGTHNNLKHLKYEDRYISYKKDNKIVIHNSLIVDDNYFIHLKVPSESQNKEMIYDVVIEFFTDEPSAKQGPTVAPYNINVFSNSPGFVYKYAALYKEHGMLIEALYGKFGKDNLDKLPEKTNKDKELFYDSTIFYACRFLDDNTHTRLIKSSIKINKAHNIKTFIEGISDIENINISRDIYNLEKGIKNEITKDAKDRKSINKKQEQLNKDKLIAKSQNKITANDKISPIKKIIKKITPKKATKTSVKKKK